MTLLVVLLLLGGLWVTSGRVEPLMPHRAALSGAVRTGAATAWSTGRDQWRAGAADRATRTADRRHRWSGSRTGRTALRAERAGAAVGRGVRVAAPAAWAGLAAVPDGWRTGYTAAKALTEPTGHDCVRCGRSNARWATQIRTGDNGALTGDLWCTPCRARYRRVRREAEPWPLGGPCPGCPDRGTSERCEKCTRTISETPGGQSGRTHQSKEAPMSATPRSANDAHGSSSYGPGRVLDLSNLDTNEGTGSNMSKGQSRPGVNVEINNLGELLGALSDLAKRAGELIEPMHQTADLSRALGDPSNMPFNPGRPVTAQLVAMAEAAPKLETAADWLESMRNSAKAVSDLIATAAALTDQGVSAHTSQLGGS